MWASGVFKRVDVGFRIVKRVDVGFEVLEIVWKSASECLES